MTIPVISVTIERRRCTCGCDKPSVSKCSGKLAGESVDRAPEKGVASKKPPANGPQGGGNHPLVQVGGCGGGGGIPPVKESADYGTPPATVVSGSGKPPSKVGGGSGKPPEKVFSGSGKPPEKGGNPLVKGVGGGGFARARPLRHLAVLLAVFYCLCAAVAADTSQPEEKSKFTFKKGGWRRIISSADLTQSLFQDLDFLRKTERCGVFFPVESCIRSGAWMLARPFRALVSIQGGTEIFWFL
jgi:hypothetical protein